MDAQPTAGWRRAAFVGAGAVAALAAVLVVAPGGRATVAADDAITFLSASAAAFAAARAARRSTHATRRGWALLAVACALWATGEAIWGVYEVILAREVPLPSIADVAYLAAILPAAAALLSFPGGPRGGVARTRAVLDGCLVAASLLFVVWAVVLGDAWRASVEAPLGQAITLLYPLTDVVLATLAVMAVTRGPAARRRPIGLVAVGVTMMAVADVVYGWLSNRGAYTSGSVIDVVWVAAYVLVALAALHPDAVVPARRASDDDTAAAGILAPYIPVVAAAVACGARLLATGGLGPFLAGTGLVAVFTLVARQFTALADNLRLTARLRATVDELESRRAELRHVAYHDALTGLPNRALFFDQLTAAATSAPAAVLYVDLDGFKSVNDGLGHAAGDELLVEVARRLRATAGRQGLVARLGGDEFAVLISGPAVGIAERVASELRHAVSAPVVIQGEEVRPSASVGVAVATEPGQHADELVRWADAAMYSAKRAGRAAVAVVAATGSRR